MATKKTLSEYESDVYKAKGPRERRLAMKRLAQAKQRARNPEAIRDKHLRTLYGITIDDYEAMLKAQDYRCAICRIPDVAITMRAGRYLKQLESPLQVDHCHLTGVVRGLLCNECNSGLSKLGDSVDGLMVAVRYLQGPR